MAPQCAISKSRLWKILQVRYLGLFTNKLQGMKEMDRNLLKGLKELSKFKTLSKTIVSRRAYLDLKNCKNVRKQR